MSSAPRASPASWRRSGRTSSSRSATRCSSTQVSVDISADDDLPGIAGPRDGQVEGKTGVEMEALTAVSARLPHHLRHGKGHRPRHADRRNPPRGKDRRPQRRLPCRADSPVHEPAAGRRGAAPRSSPASSPLGAETVPLSEARGRILAADLAATPDPAALRRLRHGRLRGARRRCGGGRRRLRLDRRTPRRSGAFAARSARARRSASSPARRCRTAPTPILIQENAARDGERVSRHRAGDAGPLHPAAPGSISHAGDVLLRPARGSTRATLALAAAMNHADPPGAPPPACRDPRHRRRARAARRPGPGPTRSSPRTASASPPSSAKQAASRVDLGIAPRRACGTRAQRSTGAGGRRHPGRHRRRLGRRPRHRPAVARRKGMKLDFWRIAMRPGKPLMFGRLGPMRVLGLPGNPVSALRLRDALPAAADPGAARRGAVTTNSRGAVSACTWRPTTGAQDYVRAR